MVTLPNGSQTMAKGIDSTRPPPSVPLIFVLYVTDCPFNLISINKLTCHLNCLITVENHRIFSDLFPRIFLEYHILWFIP